MQVSPPSGEIQVNGDACEGNQAVTVEAERTYHFTVSRFLLGYVSNLEFYFSVVIPLETV